MFYKDSNYEKSRIMPAKNTEKFVSLMESDVLKFAKRAEENQNTKRTTEGFVPGFGYYISRG